MANQGFAQSLNLLEVPDGAELLQNLAGGTVDADMRLFAGLSSKRSQLFWDRFYNSVSVEKSPSTLTQATQFQWQTDYTYTDEDTVSVTPINLIRDIGASFIGFDGDGLLSNNLGGEFIAFDRGEGYAPGTYTNLNLQGGNGTGATANIVVQNDGTILSVEVTDSGEGYSLGDTFTAPIPGNGVGFNVRIIANPWKVVIVGNYAWNIFAFNSKQLTIEVANTSAALNGTYEIKLPDTGVNVWHLPNNNSSPAFDINRQVFATTKISTNKDLFDIDGDGQCSITDAGLIYSWSNAKVNGQTGESAINTYINNTSLPVGATRNNTQKIFNYLEGLNPSLWDIDGTGFNIYDNPTQAKVNRMNSFFDDYVANSTYGFPSASSLTSLTPTATAATTEHVVAVEFTAPRDPKYSVPAEVVEEYQRPYFILRYAENQNQINAFDNFVEYGSQQLCTTSQNDWINNVQVGSFNSTLNYRIVNKTATTTSQGQTLYFVTIVAAGNGKPVGVPFGTNPTLTPSNSSPVFDASSEYGVFDSNSSNNFFLRTNPRSSDESNKKIITFSERYIVNNLISTYNNEIVDVTTLIPDIILQRDDSLTTENIENLEAPIVVDDGRGNDYTGASGSFSYDISGYSSELNNITDNVDESIYLRSTKYRIDRNLFYVKEIVVNGFMSSFDPDSFNLTATDLTKDNSPGIFISSAASQITNPLAADFANRTRSFSSDYNPWRDNAVPNALSTESLSVTINDLLWTSEIKLDVGTNAQNGYDQGLTKTLDEEFNEDTVDDGESFKLKMTINGEEYFIIMRKS